MVRSKLAVSGFPCPLSVGMSECIKDLMLSKEEDATCQTSLSPGSTFQSSSSWECPIVYSARQNQGSTEKKLHESLGFWYVEDLDYTN